MFFKVRLFIQSMKIYIMHLWKEELYSLCKTLTRECEVHSVNLKNIQDWEKCADVIHQVWCTVCVRLERVLIAYIRRLLWIFVQTTYGDIHGSLQADGSQPGTFLVCEQFEIPIFHRMWLKTTETQVFFQIPHKFFFWTSLFNSLTRVALLEFFTHVLTSLACTGDSPLQLIDK